MKGATDEGRHIEGMRTGRMKSGHCELRATGCQGHVKVLEKHHESYKPERCIYVCHHCHHLLHFRPYQLTHEEKNKLLQIRYGAKQWHAFTKKHPLMRSLIKNYIGPGRRPAQLEVRRRLKRTRS